MITRKVFWEDPYLTQLETTIQTVTGNHITVAETIFYAFSGGQESDYGTIGGSQVLSAQKKDKLILYTLTNAHQLKVGDTVKIIIDWNRRYALMRLHMAAELVLELLYQKFPTVIKIGAHIAHHKARIDVKWDHTISPFINEIEDEAQKIIDSQQEIISAYSDRTNERRYWKITGFSQVPCGGTHIKNSYEIGIITLKRSNLGKGKERIEIFIADRNN